MASLIDLAIAGDVIVVAGEAEAFLMAGYQGGDGEGLVAAGGAAVNNNQMNLSHRRYIQLVTPSAVAMAERTLIKV